MPHEYEPPTGDVLSVSKYIRNALELVKDEETAVDTGGGFTRSELWVTIEGKEFFVSITEKKHLGLISGAMLGKGSEQV